MKIKTNKIVKNVIINKDKPEITTEKKWLKITEISEIEFPIDNEKEEYKYFGKYPMCFISTNGDRIIIKKNAQESIHVRLNEEMDINYYKYITSLLEECKTNFDMYEDDNVTDVWSGEEEQEIKSKISIGKLK
jgi:hypothetical protein